MRPLSLWLFAIVALTGCSSDSGDGARPIVNVKNDPAPLMERFPLIGTPVSATWASGDLANDYEGRITVPGPSTYYLHAIVELEPAIADDLRVAFGPSEVGLPRLRGKLQDLIPHGQYETGAELSAAFTTPDWAARVYLMRGGNVLLISSSQRDGTAVAPTSTETSIVAPPTS